MRFFPCHHHFWLSFILAVLNHLSRFNFACYACLVCQTCCFPQLLMFQSRRLMSTMDMVIILFSSIFFFRFNLNNHIFVYLAKIIKNYYFHVGSMFFLKNFVPECMRICLLVYSLLQLNTCCVDLIACINACTLNQNQQKKGTNCAIHFDWQKWFNILQLSEAALLFLI